MDEEVIVDALNVKKNLIFCLSQISQSIIVKLPKS